MKMKTDKTQEWEYNEGVDESSCKSGPGHAWWSLHEESSIQECTECGARRYRVIPRYYKMS